MEYGGGCRGGRAAVVGGVGGGGSGPCGALIRSQWADPSESVVEGNPLGRWGGSEGPTSTPLMSLSLSRSKKTYPEKKLPQAHPSTPSPKADPQAEGWVQDLSPDVPALPPPQTLILEPRRPIRPWAGNAVRTLETNSRAWGASAHRRPPRRSWRYSATSSAGHRTVSLAGQSK